MGSTEIDMKSSETYESKTIKDLNKGQKSKAEGDDELGESGTHQL